MLLLRQLLRQPEYDRLESVDLILQLRDVLPDLRSVLGHAQVEVVHHGGGHRGRGVVLRMMRLRLRLRLRLLLLKVLIRERGLLGSGAGADLKLLLQMDLASYYVAFDTFTI